MSDHPSETVELPRLLTDEEAADYLRIGEQTLYQLISSPEIPVVRIGGCNRFDTKDLRCYIEASKETGPRR